MIHEMKVSKEIADAIGRGSKRFDIRTEGERWFEVGDRIRYIVVGSDGEPAPWHAVNRMLFKVSFVQREEGLKPGYVALGIKRMHESVLDYAADGAAAVASQPLLKFA